MTTRTAKRIRTAATAAALIAVTIGLAGCAGNGHDGEYIGLDESSGRFNVLTVEGDNITLIQPGPEYCDDEISEWAQENKTFTGVLNKDRTTVVWTSPKNNVSDGETISFTDDTVTSSYQDVQAAARTGTPQADAIFDAQCG